MHIPLITLAERAGIKIGNISDTNLTLYVTGVRLASILPSALRPRLLYLCSEEKCRIQLTVTGVNRKPVWQETVSETRSAEEVLNRLLEITEQFDKWDFLVHELFYQRQSLQKTVRILSKMMGNPVYLVDASYKVIAIDDSALYSEISAIWRHLTQYRYLSYDIIAKMREHNELQKLDGQKAASLFHSEVFPNDFINRNLVRDGRITGHLFVVGYNKQITPGDIALAEQLSQFLEKALRDDLSAYTSRGRDYENFFVHMIEGKTQDPSLISKQLSMLHWTIQQDYLVGIIKPETMTDAYTEAICRAVEKIHDGKPVIYKEHIVAVFAPKQKTDYSDICQRLSAFSHKERCVIGISDTFSDFLHINTYYQQAMFAAVYLASGIQRGTLTKYTCLYSEVALFHILHAAADSIDLSLPCDPSIEKLSEYDRLHQTDYLHTLEVFLNNERNITNTTADLFIHRSTMLYRIERLKKLLSVDLNDPTVRLRLLFSIYIYKLKAESLQS